MNLPVSEWVYVSALVLLSLAVIAAILKLKSLVRSLREPRPGEIFPVSPTLAAGLHTEFLLAYQATYDKIRQELSDPPARKWHRDLESFITGDLELEELLNRWHGKLPSETDEYAFYEALKGNSDLLPDPPEAPDGAALFTVGDKPVTPGDFVGWEGVNPPIGVAEKWGVESNTVKEPTCEKSPWPCGDLKCPVHGVLLKKKDFCDYSNCNTFREQGWCNVHFPSRWKFLHEEQESPAYPPAYIQRPVTVFRVYERFWADEEQTRGVPLGRPDLPPPEPGYSWIRVQEDQEYLPQMCATRAHQKWELIASPQTVKHAGKHLLPPQKDLDYSYDSWQL